MTKCTVIGAGAWGTAIATALRRAGSEVRIWAREKEVVDAINTQHENTTFLRGIAMDSAIVATDDLAEVLKTEVIYLVVPSQFLRATCEQIRDLGLDRHTAIVICSKGVENGSLKLMTEVVEESLGQNPILVMSGPTFATEVGRGLPVSVTLAGEKDGEISRVRLSIESESFKVFPTYDLVGAEIGGAVKNVIAIACGIAQGSGLGENAKAALMVRGIREMKRLCEAKGGSPDTLMQLCGMGDLILTANSQESRNFSLGYKLGKGEKLDSIMASRNTVAEGVVSSESVHKLAKKLNVSLPICETVYRIVHGKEDINKTIRELIRES